MTRSTIVLLALAAAPSLSRAQEPTNYNVRGSRTEAIIATEEQRDGWYNGSFHFAPAHRAGDFVYFSGVVAGAWEGEPLDREGYKEAIRTAMQTIEATLAAAGASFQDVVKLRTFHVFDSPLVEIGKVEQVEALAEVKGEFIPEPHPAWTAVGTTALLPDNGLVEIEIVAYDPR